MVKEYNLKTHIKGYHAYMTKWTPKNGEILKGRPQPENQYDKYAVELKDVVMWLDIFLKEGLYVSPKLFGILYVQAMKTADGLSSPAKE